MRSHSNNRMEASWEAILTLILFVVFTCIIGSLTGNIFLGLLSGAAVSIWVVSRIIKWQFRQFDQLNSPPPIITKLPLPHAFGKVCDVLADADFSDIGPWQWAILSKDPARALIRAAIRFEEIDPFNKQAEPGHIVLTAQVMAMPEGSNIYLEFRTHPQPPKFCFNANTIRRRTESLVIEAVLKNPRDSEFCEPQ